MCLSTAASASSNFTVPPPKLYIDGEFVDASKSETMPVYSPRDGSVVAELANASAGDVDLAVAAAQRCFSEFPGGFPGSPPEERAVVLNKMAEGLRDRMEEFAWAESMDCGKPLEESRADMEACASFFEYYADLISKKFLSSEMLPCPEDGVEGRLLREPVGVVGMITPWNFPLMQAVVKVAPALAAGCSMVLKPSPLSSMTCLMMGELARDAGLPPGALNIITGGPPGPTNSGGESCGVALGKHPGLDKMSFTGSGPTGTALLHEGANLLRPTGLELGGKGAMVILDDADMDTIVDWAMVGIFLCSGQVCSATSRIIIDEKIADDFCERLTKAVEEKLVVGDPLDAGTNMGPMVSADQRDKVLEAVSAANGDSRCESILKNPSATISGSADSNGFYVAPQIFRCKTGADGSWPEVWTEEVFGPVLAIGTFSARNVDEAVEMTNASPYGLGHTVFTGDEAMAGNVASRLRSGVVWTNINQALYPSTPFGGCKQSGFGREYGELGLEEFCHHKTVISAKPGFSWGWYGA